MSDSDESDDSYNIHRYGDDDNDEDFNMAYYQDDHYHQRIHPRQIVVRSSGNSGVQINRLRNQGTTIAANSGPNDLPKINLDINTLLAHVIFTPSTLPRSESNAKFSPFLDLITITASKLSPEFAKLIPMSVASFDAWNSFLSSPSQQRNKIPEKIESSHSNNDAGSPQTKTRIATQIACMKPGTLLPFYLEKHNVAILLRKDAHEDTISMSFFQVKPDPTLVTENQNLRTTYPTHAVRIPYSDLLKSDHFAIKISNLAQIYDTIPSHQIVEWLTITLLGESDPVQSQDDNFLPINKAVRDEAFSKETARSGHWTVLKVAIHLNMVQELGLEEGTFIYKNFMIRMTLKIMQEFKNMDTFDVNIWDELRKKLCFKGVKLQKMRCPEGQEFSKIHKEILTDVGHTLDWVNNFMEINIQRGTKYKREKVTDEKTPFLEGLMGYLKSRKNQISIAKIMDSSTRQDRQSGHGEGTRSYFSTSEMTSEDVHEFENRVQTNEPKFDGLEELRDKLIKYSNLFPPAFSSDAVASSRMVLTLLKGLKICDEAATKEFPLLSQHSPLQGDIFPILEKLLVTTKQDEILAEEIRAYFQARKIPVTYLTTLINQDYPSHESPTVRLARQSGQVQDTIKKSVETIGTNVTQKYEEIAAARKKKEELEIKHRYAACTCDFTDIPYKRRRYNPHPDYSCEKNILYKEISALKVSTYVYPMPVDSSDNQNALMYEKCIPPSVAALRDVMLLTAIYLFPSVTKERLTRSTPGNYSSIKNISKLFELKKQHTYQDNLSIKDTHSDYPFFVKNESVQFVWNSSYKYNKIPEIIFHNKLQPSSLYKGLEPFLANWTPNHNKVMALSDFDDLNQSERIEFGQFRTGHRLQYRNMYRALSSGTLCLNRDVLTLVVQSLWQLGPWDVNFGRESHFELKSNSLFVAQFINLLEEIHQNTKDNWTAAFTLMIIQVIAKQILEYNENSELQQRSNNLLQICRNTAHRWIQEINKFVETCPKEQAGVREQLLNCAICGALTFTGSNMALQMSNSQDAMDWLCFREIIFNENKSTGSKDKNIQQILLSLLNHENYSINKKLQEIIKTDISVLNKFAKKHPGLESLSASKWEENKSIYSLSKNEFYLSLDSMTGEFLINGKPSSRLPEEIFLDKNFQKVFGQTNFQVSCKPTPTQFVYSTKETANGSTFQFHQPKNRHYLSYNEAPQRLIITEKRNTSAYELIPIDKIDLPEALLEKYSHWWNIDRNIVEFRSESFANFHFLKPKYILHLNSKVLLDVATQSCLIHNEQTAHMLTVLSSFENPKYVLIWLEGGEIIAKLPRHNISLRYHSDLGIICQEYNMVVMADYDLQTLSGLRQALVLEELNAQQRGMKLRKVLVPHGNIEVQYGGRITINTTELRNPPSLVIDVDEVLKVLTAGPYTYAWLYLAALHAVTTSPMRDSFTGQTGLERAVQILSSGRCRSSSPYDDESLVTIKFLCGLYPTRKIQEDKISRRLRNKPIEQIKVKFERVAFPKHLSAYAAYEGYYFILKALLQESNSLNFLFPTTKRLESSVELNNVDENLMARSYWRRIRFYNPAAAIPFEFMPASYNAPNPAVNFESAHLLQMDKRAYHLRVLAALCSSRKFTSANPDRVRTLIYRSEHLEGLKPTAVDDLLDLYKDLRPHWIQLYQKAITQPWEEWTLTVCEIGYKSVLDLADLLILQTIAANRLKFPKAPIIPEYKNINEIEFNSARVATILKDRKTGFSEYNNSSIWSTIGNVNSKDVPDKKQFEDSAAWEAAQAAYISEAIKKIELAWIAWSGAKRSNKSTSDATEIFSEISRTISSSIFFQRRNYYSSIIESSHDKIAMLLCEVFQTWEDNYALKLFVEAVETRLSTCGGYKDFDQIGTLVMPESSEFVRLMGKLVLCRGEIRARSWSKLRIIRMPKITKNTSHTTESVYQSLNSLITAMWKNLEDCYKEDDVLVFPADLSERLVPSRLFPKLLEQLPPDLNQFLLHLARKTRHFQRLFRILSYKRDEKKAYLYKNEKLNKPETNWTSEEFPEWLLLELELNLTIRGIQARIAKHMMDLNSGGSKVTQLNMGEGKTSVILPMVISRLAKAKEKCVRVTVLKSLFQTNYQQLKHALGSLLGQMVYSIPCDRNSTLETDQVEAVLALQKDILKRKGVIVTVPEYRLSWELRAYESYGNPIFCRSLINLFSWNEVNCQDILDESDEILSARYQKVYAMGASSKISEIRWKTCQKILKWIPNILRKLSRDARFTDCVEIDDNIGTKNKYPRCRLLNYTTQSDLCYDTFSAIITTDFIELELPHLPEDLRADIKKYLTDSSITSDLYYRLESEELLKPKFALIQAVAELLSHPGIFKCALNKRWRVNYGVSGKNSRMAVPFKAKDVAFDKTEFGHPAMGIVLTQLSYYYSGLTEQQVDVCLDVLEKRENPVVEFNEWLAFCDNLDISYQSLNRAFPPQRVRLYPALMYNTVVIDFYLTHCVFPKELKCYPGKITTTAWDLCYSEGNNVAGFSGTNDAQLLLPMHIKQDDLVELQDTNEQVRKAVEQSEDYCALESWIPEGTHILEMIAKKRIKILIDAGALMIDMDNSKVADVMLELDYSLEGVVFFNEDNKLIVRSRKGKDADCDFVSSPLRESLADKCAIYIDDEHTRGTDFKFPVGAVGCVTLGGRLPRDKLVQACMRMRMLQSGEHKVSFIATKDVDNQIKSLLATNPDCDPTRSITASDVMTWVIKNSEEYEKEGLIFYSNNALNFAKKRAGLLNLQSYEDFSRFGREITDQEKGGERNEEFASEEIFAKIISHCFESARWPLVENSLACDKITALFEEVKGHIVTLVTDKIPNRTCFSTNLEEQQEREIELEREVQVQIARPVVQHPWPHGLDRNVRNFVVEKHFVDSGEGIVELQVPSIFATRDFIRVVQHGEILRPVNWVVSRSEGGILILSPYEVNELLPYFWRGEVNSNLDMFSARVKNLGDILINVSSLQLGQRLGGKIEGDTLSRLHLYGGSLYFEDNEAAWVKKLIKELNGKFNIVKNVEKRLQYFPENCDLRKFTNC